MFGFNQLWPVAVFLWLIPVVAAILVARRKVRKVWTDSYSYNKITIPRKTRRKHALTTFLVLAVILNGLSWFMTAGGSGTTSVEIRDSGVYPTEGFGLKPDVAYPMSLGQLGFTSSTTITRAPFYFSFQERSGAATLVSVTHGADTYFLQIPVGVTTYHQVDGIEPSMVLHFKTGTICRSCGVMGQMQETVTTTYDKCKSQFTNLLWSCMRGEPIATESVVDELTPEQIRAGLSYWVENYLDSAEIWLTPEMHDKLIGKIS